MAVKTASDGRIVKDSGAASAGGQKKKETASLVSMLQDPKMIAEIGRALPKHVTPDRIVRIVLTALRVTKDLAKTTPESFMGCVLTAAQLGLEVNTPMQHAYLIPRKNNKLGTIECTLIVGYQGMIELSMRSGKILGINAQVVRDGDEFDYELGLTPKLVHRHSKAADREDKPVTYAYAVARIKDAEPVFEVLSAAQLMARMERSAASSSGPWQTDLEAMCRKTAVRALWKWIPKSSEMANAEHIEQSVELGKAQTSAFDESVRESLSRTGLEPIDTTGEEDGAELAHDENGELSQQQLQAQTTAAVPQQELAQQRERVPGEDG